MLAQLLSNSKFFLKVDANGCEQLAFSRQWMSSATVLEEAGSVDCPNTADVTLTQVRKDN
jgi:hypothetical protein